MAKRSRSKATRGAATKKARPVRRASGVRAAPTRAAPKRAAAKRPPAKPASRRPAGTSALFAPLKGAECRDLGHVRLDVGQAGAARVKRMIYPAGFRWSVDMRPVVGTDLCMHAHVGFLAHGEIHIEYADGCIVEFKAPQVVAIEPGHDGWVVGQQPVVLIEIDFERDTVARLGMPDSHQHG